MADSHVKHDTLNKELVAVVGRVKKTDASVIAHSALEIGEELLAVLSEIKRTLKAVECWTNKPESPGELVVRNSLEYAALCKLREDSQSTIDKQASKLAKKSHRS